MSPNSYLTLIINPNSSNSNISSPNPNFSSSFSKTSHPKDSNLSFKIIKATIKESLESPFSVECESY